MIDTSILKEICLKAGEIILEIYSSDDFEIQTKADSSPLTRADTAANTYIVTELKKHYPHIPILAEESVNASYSERKNWSECFIVDPIDGTKEFIKKNGEFTVNIGYAENGIIKEGVIYAPVLETFYYTNKGIAFREKTGITQKLPCERASAYTFVTSRSHPNDETTQYIEKLKKEKPELILLEKGSSLKLCMIAEGSAHEYTRFGPTMEWDTAAGQAIVEASGGSVLCMETNTSIRYNRENLKNKGFTVYEHKVN